MMLASNLTRHAQNTARALHSCSARSLCRFAAFLLLVGLGTAPAYADLKLCNTTASRVGVSIGYKDAEGWATEGWWNISSRSCETLLKGDHYMHLADLTAYLEADRRMDALYADRRAWARKAILNVAGSGKFSSDRTIKQYAAEIWHAKPCPVA